jgi:hypothetical protein
MEWIKNTMTTMVIADAYLALVLFKALQRCSFMNPSHLFKAGSRHGVGK